ncbi:MAG: WW domain-containing protein [Janthinobacterium lividum]
MTSSSGKYSNQSQNAGATMLPRRVHFLTNQGHPRSTAQASSHADGEVVASTPLPSMLPPPLAKGWQETRDAQNKTCYFNEQTGQTSRNRPVSPTSVGAGTGNNALSGELAASLQQLRLSPKTEALAAFTPEAYVEKFGPHISSDDIRSFNRNGKPVGRCRDELHAYILKNRVIKESMMALGGPGAGKSYLMMHVSPLLSKTGDAACLTDDNAFYENIRDAVKSGLPTTIYWITAPFAHAMARVNARSDSYPLDYQLESHVDSLEDFKKCCKEFKKYANFHPVAIVNPSDSKGNAALASIKTFHGADAARLASRWIVGEREDY